MAIPALISLGVKVVGSPLVRRGAVIAAGFVWNEFKPAIKEKFSRDILPNISNAISDVWHSRDNTQLLEPVDPDLC